MGVVLLVGLCGCHSGSSKLGAGVDVNACDGVTILNGLPEPDLTNKAAILDYSAGALRVLSRIDSDLKVHTKSDTKIAVPSTIVTALQAEKTAYTTLQRQVTATTTVAALHGVVQGFTNSTAFAGADSTVELWAGNE